MTDTSTQFTVEGIRTLRDGYKPDPDRDLDEMVLKRIEGLIAALASVGESAVRVPYAWITENVRTNLNQRGFRVFPQGNTFDDTMGVSWEPWENEPHIIKERLALVKANIWALLHPPVQEAIDALLAGDTRYVLLYNNVKVCDPGATHWKPDLLYHWPQFKTAEAMRLSALGWANLAVRSAIARDVWEGCCGPGFIDAVKEAMCRQRLSEAMHHRYKLKTPEPLLVEAAPAAQEEVKALTKEAQP